MTVLQGGDTTDEAMTAAMADLASLPWPDCNEDTLQQLLQLLGDAVFAAGEGSALGFMPGSSQLDIDAALQQQIFCIQSCAISQLAVLHRMVSASHGITWSVGSVCYCISLTCVCADVCRFWGAGRTTLCRTTRKPADVLAAVG
jgi:hypothetical protein